MSTAHPSIGRHRFVRVTLAILLGALYLLPSKQVSRVEAASGDEALQSTLILQMPFVNGETWTVGGGGYFYGEVTHTNAANDYYATDWNRANDAGALVLPVVFGTVDSVVNPLTSDCELETTGYGCYVRIVHSDGYRTLYGHLSNVYVGTGDKVQAWTLLGTVGDTGGADGSHLHLRFQRLVSGTYYSHCNTGVPPNNKCPNGEDPIFPQGHKPSPMMTTSGLVNLQDASSYTSVNGRIYLSQLRNNYGGDGLVSYVYLRNNTNQARNATVYYFGANGSPTPKVSDVCFLYPQAECLIIVNSLNRIPGGTFGSAYVDSDGHTSVAVVNTGAKKDAFEGVPAAASVAGIGVGTSLRIPAYYNNYYGWNSTLMVQNVGNANSIVTARLYSSAGTQIATSSASINAKGSTQLSLPAASSGAVSITASGNQLISAMVRHDLGGGDSMVYVAQVMGSTTAYVPSLFKN